MSPISLDRRGFLALSGAGLATLAVSACGGPSTSDSGAKTTNETDWTKVQPAKEISFLSSHPGKSSDAEAKIIEAFTAATQIKVNLITGGANYEDVAAKFQTQQGSSDISDVVVASDVWWFRHAINDLIVPLDDGLMKAAEMKQDTFQKTLFDDYLHKNVHWAAPYARSTPLFYYNKKHFAAAGLPDRAPETWEEFAEWAPKLQEANKSQPGYLHAYQYPALAGYAGWTLQNLLWGRGTGWSKEWDITCASDEAVKAMQWVQETINTAKWAGVSSKDAIVDMGTGAVSATVSSTGDLVGALKTAKENGMEYGVGNLPGGPAAKTPVCPTGGAGLVIAKKTSPERQLAAAKFVAFATNAKMTQLFSSATGYMPVRTDADMTDVLNKTPQIKVAYEQLKVTRSQDFARVFLPGADTELAKSAAKIMNEKADVKTTLDALEQTLEGIYKRDVQPKLR